MIRALSAGASMHTDDTAIEYPSSLRKLTAAGPGGRTLSFEVTGEGAAVILLPPGASGASAWRQVTRQMSLGCQTIAVNHSGYGLTESFIAVRPMTLDDEADAVLSITQNFSQPMHLVGHSFGGAVAVRLAVRAPERFKSLVLIEPASYPLLHELGESLLAREVHDVNRRFVRQVQCNELQSAFELYLAYYNGDRDAFRDLTVRAKERLLGLSSTVAAALTAVHMDVTSLADWAAVNIPTLLVRGERTDPMHRILTERMRAARPMSRLETVSGAGHLLSISHPGETARLLTAHCGRY